LVVDSFAIVVGDDASDEQHEKLPPISIVSSCVPSEPNNLARCLLGQTPLCLCAMPSSVSFALLSLLRGMSHLCVVAVWASYSAVSAHATLAGVW
jgi:hypothetical protein